MIIKFKKAKLKSMLLVTLFMIIMTLAVYGMTVTLNDPDDGVWWTSSNSVDHNFTPVTSGVEVLDFCTIYSNRTGTWGPLVNYTTVNGLTNNTPFIRGIDWSDTNNNSMGWNVSCYNGTDHIWSGPQTFGVDANPPEIILDSPSAGSYEASGTLSLDYTPTDEHNLNNCSIYHNVSGSWALNITNITVVSGTQDMSEMVITDDGNYIWNVICNGTASNSAWAEDTNRTFTLDTTAPTGIVFLSPSNGSVTTDTTPRISWNQTIETNFEKYVVKVSTSASNFTPNVIQTSNDILSRTSNETTLRELPTNDEYFLIVTAFDLAGNEVNTTTQLTLSIDSTAPTVTLSNPLNNTYTTDTTPIFNVTVVDDNPDTCILWLSNSTNVVINVTNTTVFSGTPVFLRPTTMIDGTYKFNIECNDSLNNRVNVSSSLLDLTIDTTAPTAVDLTITWGQTNNTDKTPALSWLTTTETNFERYFIRANKISDNSLEYSVNITTRTTNFTALTLSAGDTYNFSVIAYDLAGNSIQSVNTTSTIRYYVDEVCGTLEAGWNLCGATWTAAKNLSIIGSETSATFITVWNSTHDWSTCILGASTNNCDIDTGISNSLIGHVWVYVSAQTEWRNRTWVATQLSANITLTNISNGWNIIPGEFRNGRSFGVLGREFTVSNVSMFSLPYINGSVASFVNKDPFNEMAINETVLNYGKAMWTFYNGTGFPGNLSNNHTFDVGSW